MVAIYRFHYIKVGSWSYCELTNDTPYHILVIELLSYLIWGKWSPYTPILCAEIYRLYVGPSLGRVKTVVTTQCDFPTVSWRQKSPTNSLFRLTAQKINTPHNCPFVCGNHRWSVDSPHKGPVVLKSFLCSDVIMWSCTQLWHRAIRS